MDNLKKKSLASEFLNRDEDLTVNEGASTIFQTGFSVKSLILE